MQTNKRPVTVSITSHTQQPASCRQASIDNTTHL